MLAQSASDASAAVNAYATTKRSHLNTEEQCQEEGITFIPMIVDGAGGGWGDDAERVWATLARTIANNTNGEASQTSADLYQSLSLILHREGARAVLRRLSGAVDGPNHALATARAALGAAPGTAILDDEI